jgi:hypothetical protein
MPGISTENLNAAVFTASPIALELQSLNHSLLHTTVCLKVWGGLLCVHFYQTVTIGKFISGRK